LSCILCSLLTIFPDYLYRRYRQGKRFGHEITLFSVWFELRFGIIACLMLTVALITMIFYYHPSTNGDVVLSAPFRSSPKSRGRVAEVHVDYSAPVKQGDVIFRLDSAKQEAALETAKRKIAEVDAAMLAAQADVLKAEGQLQEAKGAAAGAGRTRHQARVAARNPGIVPQRDIEKLEVAVAGVRARSMPRTLRNNPRRRASPRSFRPRRQARRRRWPKRRSIWTRPSFAPASTAASSSSCCARVTSSIR
jgi:multidrug resistance efflux pump